MTVGKVRTWLYRLARLLGDLTAVLRRRVGQRIARRFAGKWTARGLGKIFRR